MHKTIFWIMLSAALFIAPLAFAEPEDTPVGKKDFVSGAEITDARFAAHIAREKEDLYFMDLASAFRWRSGECIATQMACDASLWVFDYYTRARIHMRAAYYVISKTVTTPRASGALAFADEEGVKRFFKQSGEAQTTTLDFDQMQEKFN